MKAIKGRVYGKVQGVGFRMYAYRQADRLGITGWIKNLSDGSVEFFCQASDVELSYFIDLLKRGNTSSVVENLEYHDSEITQSSSFLVKD